MSAEKEVYEHHAAEYEALVSREDYQGNILMAIHELVPLDGLKVLDLGAGTGRLACLLQPHVARVIAFDLSMHMLRLTLGKLRRLTRDPLVAASDHRFLPLPERSVDLIVSGWSVSYLAVWEAHRWREAAEAWLREARRVLCHGGRIVLFESLGTGNEIPRRLPHLENFYDWLDGAGFQSRWIRTDYRFESPEAAARIAGFFFGDELKARIARERITMLPECTGIWWLHG